MRTLLPLLAASLAASPLLADPTPPPAIPTVAEVANKDASAKPGPAEAKTVEGTKADKDSKGKEVTTEHVWTAPGQPSLAYTATAGLLPLRDAEGKVTANLFYIAYTKNGVSDLTKRPVTFSFNGGPGSSSVWMHLGLLGPRRIKLQEDGTALPPPHSLIDNEYSLLDETDLVFIDPVGTGYSRAHKPEEAKKFYGVQEDAQSIAEFIRLYTTRNARWASPKFLIGESYGTTRAAALSSVLADKHRMNLNGIMLVSTVLNFQTIAFNEGNDLPHVLYLPSYTATAWYHKKLPADLLAKPLTEVLKTAEEFALTTYNRALMLGDALPKEDQQSVVAEMARLTGLKSDFITKARLRPGLGRFNIELLRDQNRQVGRFDSRYSGYLRDTLNEHAEGDPSADVIFGTFTAGLGQYLRTELKYESDEPYEILARVGPWNWSADNEYLNVADALAASMTANPFLKVHVSSGYTDMATPYFATRYTLNHLQIDPELRKNITLDEYTAGHMMYLNLPDLRKQKADLAKFIRAAYTP